MIRVRVSGWLRRLADRFELPPPAPSKSEPGPSVHHGGFAAPAVRRPRAVLAAAAAGSDGPPATWLIRRRTELRALSVFEGLIEAAAEAAEVWVHERGGDGDAAEAFVEEACGLADLRRDRQALALDLEFADLAHDVERGWRGEG